MPFRVLVTSAFILPLATLLGCAGESSPSQQQAKNFSGYTYEPRPQVVPTSGSEPKGRVNDSGSEKAKNLIAILELELERRNRNREDLLAIKRKTVHELEKKAASQKQITAAKEDLRYWEDRIEAAISDQQDLWQAIEPNQFQIGQVGKLPGKAGARLAEIFQITGEQESLLRSVGGTLFADRHGELAKSVGGVLFILQGVSTAGHVDRQTVNLDQILEVVGTKRYATAIGGSNTVFVVEPLDSKVANAVETALLKSVQRFKEQYEEAKKTRLEEEAKSVAARLESEAHAAQKARLQAEEAKRLAEQKAKAEIIARDENAAAVLLKLAKDFKATGQTDLARKRLLLVIDKYPETKVAAEAKKLLAELK